MQENIHEKNIEKNKFFRTDSLVQFTARNVIAPAFISDNFFLFFSKRTNKPGF